MTDISALDASRPWEAERSSIEELLDLCEPPPWHADALCREYPRVTWLPERHVSAARAKAICKRCAVIDECGAFALAAGRDLAGIWAGLDQQQRRSIIGTRASRPPDPRRARAGALREAGMSTSEIAAYLSVDKSTITRWAKAG